MANIIKHKRSSTAGAIPTASQLEQGQIAINLTDKKLYTKDATNTVVLLNPDPPVVPTTGLVPSGTVIHVAMNIAPTGYLKADGTAVSRTTYATLFTAIGTTFGVGDGSTTFNLPDLRGEFIRGWADGRSVDTGRSFGSFQDQAFASHSHSASLIANFSEAGTPDRFSGYSGDNGNIGSASTNAAGGSETRPRNVALLACIKT